MLEENFNNESFGIFGSVRSHKYSLKCCKKLILIFSSKIWDHDQFFANSPSVTMITQKILFSDGYLDLQSLILPIYVIMIIEGEAAKYWSWSQILELKIKINFLQHFSGYFWFVTLSNRPNEPLLKFSSKMAQID